jgi:hypothetical protein
MLGSSTGSTGVYGVSTSGTGVYGQGGSYAGLFVGPVVVQGDFTVVGGVKSAAVPHPDGSLRRLCAIEAPESWFEDFGEGQLANGRGEVRFDPDFAAVVRTQDFHVFLTPQGDCNGLFVGRRSASGFEVRELRAGTASVSFSYRVVAKRKDVNGRRLERVAKPAVQSAPQTPSITIEKPPTPPRR